MASRGDILLLERNADDILFFNKFLAGRYNVSATLDEKEGLEMAKNKRYDAIVTEYSPRSLDFIADLRSLNPDVPILLFSIPFPRSMNEKIKSTVTDYVEKSINMQESVERVVVSLDRLVPAYQNIRAA